MTESPRTVLVVDDDEDIRAALCAVLEEGGYVTSAVGNGREALEALEAGPPPHAILLDLMMPVMDGWQFRAVQRADARFDHIPIIAITASGLSAESAAQLAVNRCLVKPLQIDVLLSALDRCLALAPTTPSPADRPLRRSARG